MPVFLAEVVANAILAVGINAGTALLVAGFVADYALLIGGLALSTPITLYLVPTLLVAIRGRNHMLKVQSES